MDRTSINIPHQNLHYSSFRTPLSGDSLPELDRTPHGTHLGCRSGILLGGDSTVLDLCHDHQKSGLAILCTFQHDPSSGFVHVLARLLHPSFLDFFDQLLGLLPFVWPASSSLRNASVSLRINLYYRHKVKKLSISGKNPIARTRDS